MRDGVRVDGEKGKGKGEGLGEVRGEAWGVGRGVCFSEVGEK